MYVANFKRYWKEQITHTVVAALGTVCLLIAPLRWAGAALLAFIGIRQTLEFQKRNDTPGIDLAYHMLGIILVILVALWRLTCKRDTS